MNTQETLQLETLPQRRASTLANSLESRIDATDWSAFEATLTRDGYAILNDVLTPEQCMGVADLFPQDEQFRSRIVMERYAFGRGEYKYFSYPLPDLVSRLRQALYPHLAPIANR